MNKLSKYVKSEAKKLFRMCLRRGLLDETRVHRVVEHVLSAHRRDCFSVLGHFRRLVKLDRAKHTAEIDSAVPLPPDLQAGMRVRLERMYGPGIKASFIDHPELIGGMRIRIGSDVYDGTVKGRLAALEVKF